MALRDNLETLSLVPSQKHRSLQVVVERCRCCSDSGEWNPAVLLCACLLKDVVSVLSAALSMPLIKQYIKSLAVTDSWWVFQPIFYITLITLAVTRGFAFRGYCSASRRVKTSLMFISSCSCSSEYPLIPHLLAYTPPPGRMANSDYYLIGVNTTGSQLGYSGTGKAACFQFSNFPEQRILYYLWNKNDRLA